MLHDTHYPLYNIVNVGKVALAVAVVEDLNRFAFYKFVGKAEVSHIRTTSWAIDGEEAQAR